MKLRALARNCRGATTEVAMPWLRALATPTGALKRFVLYRIGIRHPIRDHRSFRASSPDFGCNFSWIGFPCQAILPTLSPNTKPRGEAPWFSMYLV